MRLLGIEITEREIRVARGERVFGTVRLTAVERLPVEGLEQLRAHAVLTALPAQLATHRVLTLPFRDRRRLGRTAPLELLGQLPMDADGLTVAWEPIGPTPGGTAVLAAAVRRADLDAHAARLTGAGLPPARIDLAPLPAWNLIPTATDDVALLVADGTRSALTVRRAGRVVGLRALGTAATDVDAFVAEVRWTLAGLGGAPAELIVAGADGAALAPALRAALTGVRVSPIAARLPAIGDPDTLAACAVAAGLVAGAGRARRVGVALGGVRAAEPDAFRRTAVLAGLALALGALDTGLVRHQLARRDAALVRAIGDEAAAALPGVRVVAPRAQVEAAAAAATRRTVRRYGQGSALDVLREISVRVPLTVRLDLDELTVEPDALSVHGRAESFDAVDVLRRALAGSPLFAQVTADDTRTTVDGRRVEFRLRATRTAPGTSS